MIEKALKYIIGLSQKEVLDVDGQKYATGSLSRITLPKVSELKVNSLTGLVDYIKSEFDKDAFTGNLIHVVSQSEVRLISNILKDADRETYLIAQAFSPKFSFGTFYDLESFNIAMQSCFIRNDEATAILKVVGNVKEEAVRQLGDDGVTQSVTAKSGIATVEDVKVPNPVILKPYRTFIEVEQPESKFVFRMKSSSNGVQCALFEADGGAWKLDAMERIKFYLAEELAEVDIKIIS